ncbi:MAG: hypothetical protein R3264_04355 [Anaerolineae bacterium]|nr:hypothetical protein [Anaerolineae bacterium]
MTDLKQLFSQIERLSAENQQKLADIVAYLAWQERQATTQTVNDWSFSLIEHFKEAAVQASGDPAGMDVNMAQATVGGQSRPALWAHPPVAGQAIIEYHVPVPQDIGQVQLSLAFGIRDGAKIAADNLVAFTIKVNGLRVWGTQTNEKQWQIVDIPLDLPSGDISRLELTTETLGSHEWTWAVWGSPELRGKRKD